MRLNALSRWTQFVLLVGIAAISASLLFAQGGRGNPSPASAQSCEDYPIGRCDTAPNNVTLTFRGRTSGCTPTSGSCLEDELFQISAVSPTYCFGFCDRFQWTFGDNGSTEVRNGYGYIYHQFLGAGPRTVNATISNNLGSVTAPTLTIPALIGPCSAGATTLCLNGGRFKVTTQWTTRDGQTGPGQAVALTGDTGYFTFFNAANVEMVIKVLNACSFAAAPRYWVFAGGLTDVNVILTVTDTQTGVVNSYVNPQGTPFQPIQDTSKFATCGSGTPSGASLGASPTGSPLLPVTISGSSDVREACVADSTTLCLNASRFKVTTQWTTRDGQTGPGQAVALTGDTGYFTFFNAANVEMVIKVLNACSFAAAPRYWVFAGGLTDVNVILTVTDTQTGVVNSYVNPQGTPFQPIQDTSKFASCP